MLFRFLPSSLKPFPHCIPTLFNSIVFTMPKENKNGRGRREEKKKKKLKRKREDEAEAEDDVQESKRHRSQERTSPDVSFIGLDNAENIQEYKVENDVSEAADRPYYGMLEDEEQEYFRRADELLELNDFPSPEERSLFLANVYREAEGKELKLACSQSCSRLMERLILLSTAEQKKKLFQSFSGNFPHLVQHRFASHCCESLFIHSAPVVTEELTAESKGGDERLNDDEVFVSMENLFLYTLNDLEGQMATLLTDRFGSHTLRVLLIILSGRPLEKASTKSLLQSKKKEKVGINGLDSNPTELSLSKRAVPESFQYAVDKIISDTIATMDTAFIRVLATHQTGNPTLQLLLELELTNPNSKKGTNSSQKTLISTLLPDDITVEGSESSIFVNGLLYEPIGSRLLETIATHAPGKLFKQIYRTTFKDRIAGLARNEISSYVVIRVLNRLSKEDLEEAVENISTQVQGLVTRNRTVIIKTLLERCHARGAETEKITHHIAEAYGNDPSTLVLKMADISLETLTASTAPPPESETNLQKPQKPTPSQLHGSYLAQTMLSIPGPPATLLQNALLALPASTILSLSLHQTTTYIIQAALLPSPPTAKSNLLFRRKLINTLLMYDPTITASDPPVLTLSLNPTGSHILDSLLHTTTTPTSTSTSSLFSLCERIAMSLLPLEPVLRDSFSGRIVWRNWCMDLFRRRRGDWVKKIRSPTPHTSSSSSTHLQSQNNSQINEKNTRPHTSYDTSENDIGKKGDSKTAAGGRERSAIELAREKFAKEKLKGQKSGKKNTGVGTGANTV